MNQRSITRELSHKSFILHCKEVNQFPPIFSCCSIINLRSPIINNASLSIKERRDQKKSILSSFLGDPCAPQKTKYFWMRGSNTRATINLLQLEIIEIISFFLQQQSSPPSLGTIQKNHKYTTNVSKFYSFSL